MKKLGAILLALILTLTATAFAASITINPNIPADAGETTGETYTAYKVFDASIAELADEEQGTQGKVTYTIKNTDKFYSAVNGTGSPFTLTAVPGTDDTFVVTLNSDTTTGEDIANFLNAVADKGTGKASNWDATNQKATISELDPGYYLITSTLGTALVADTLGDVTINTKNAYPSLKKTVKNARADEESGFDDDTTAFMGLESDVQFKIEVAIPATASGDIVVHDHASGLNYVGDPTAVNEDNVEVTIQSTTTIDPEDGCTMHITIPAASVAANLDKTVIITYNATVKAGVEAASNNAYLTYSSFTSTKSGTEVTNYEIDVFKYTGEGENATGLANAGFKLSMTEGEVTKWYKFENGVVSWVETEAEATEYITAEANNYTVVFKGLANGTYTLVEKTVPAGYNKAADQNIVINGKDHNGEEGQEAKIEVQNNTGSELPSTGGIGTTIFYVVGGLLMVGAMIVLVTRRKVSSDKNEK